MEIHVTRPFVLVVACAISAVTLAARPYAPESVAPNDNTHRAGVLRGHVLSVALEARAGRWHPESDGGRSLDVAAFAESGKGLQTPGPFIRARVGTEVRVSIRNSLDKPLAVFGLGAKRGMADSIVIPAGETREARFVAESPGTYYYFGRRGVDPTGGRMPEDTQLHGVIVIDAAGAVASDAERVFAISWYFTINPRSPSGLGHGTMAINGLSWPHTEKLRYTQGDSVHWRVVNFTEADHPMHLHGFYFRVTEKGNGVRDSLYSASQRRMAVTEIVAPFETVSLEWLPNRPGNWIFHCHYATHLSSLVALDTEDGMSDTTAMSHHQSDRPHQMFGLVLGITVAPKGKQVASTAEPRRIRIVQRMKPHMYGDQPGMAFLVDGSPESSGPDAMPVPGPTLVLQRGQPVAVTIVNESSEHATIHWHGIELDSYPDGVPGWSGMGPTILPAIKPHDSLTVRWTPPRAGSFMYHSHFNEAQQMGRGLYGPIIVVDKGQTYDPETDRVLFFGTAGAGQNVIMGPFPEIVLNGRTQPTAMELKAGTRYRFRLFNLAGDFPTQVSLTRDTVPIQWRAVAKDGYPLPAAQAVTKPAVLMFDPGEIYDFEYTPRSAGEYTLSFGLPSFLIPPPPPPGSTAPPPPKMPSTVAVPVHVH
jgi:FtsP/CotA-like multicopper oxidase with cupredoxin domain